MCYTMCKVEFEVLIYHLCNASRCIWSPKRILL